MALLNKDAKALCFAALIVMAAIFSSCEAGESALSTLMALLNKDAKALCFAVLIVMAVIFSSCEAGGNRCHAFPGCDSILCWAECDRLGYSNPKPRCLYPKPNHDGDECCC
ncbi:hypothetical protein ZEAMMB73_Zm00001d048896 [Zea mays]|uniref:Uncharacterized protein n=2 Tax=Zea mays TaxID=4577 RepID=A0A1D6PR22_MAIZE|nr:hypothetical protein ZEAMMB73_Zm00001d048896 [Zea mays]